MATVTIDTYYLKSGKQIIDVDANAQLDFAFNWTKYLALVSDTIASVVFVVDPLLTKVNQGNDTQHATVWIAPTADALAKTLPVTCRITTSSIPPRIDDRTIWLHVVNK